MEGLKLNGLPSDAATLEKFDVILLGDLDSTYWKPQPMELLIKRVRDGAGCWRSAAITAWGLEATAGRRSRAILPVLTGGRDIGQVTEPFLPILTPAGRDHPIFANIGKFFPTSDAPAAGGRAAAAGRLCAQ